MSGPLCNKCGNLQMITTHAGHKILICKVFMHLVPTKKHPLQLNVIEPDVKECTAFTAKPLSNA